MIKINMEYEDLIRAVFIGVYLLGSGVICFYIGVMWNALKPKTGYEAQTVVTLLFVVHYVLFSWGMRLTFVYLFTTNMVLVFCIYMGCRF